MNFVVAQQVSGRLQRRWSSDGKKHVRWEGKDLGEYDVAYEDAPWEKEANAFAKKAYANIFNKERLMKVIKWIIKDLKLASKEDWFYVALGIPVSVFAYIHWFI